METVRDFIFLGSKITVDGDWSHEIKTCLLLERKAMANLDSILKSRDTTLPMKVHLVKAMVFPVVMDGCESWTIKKAECWRTDAFELWCWRRLLRVPWTARRSNQSILKEISPGCSLEGLMLKLKLQYFGHVMQRTDSLENTLMLGKIEGGRRRGWCGAWEGGLAQIGLWGVQTGGHSLIENPGLAPEGEEESWQDSAELVLPRVGEDRLGGRSCLQDGGGGGWDSCPRQSCPKLVNICDGPWGLINVWGVNGEKKKGWDG